VKETKRAVALTLKMSQPFCPLRNIRALNQIPSLGVGNLIRMRQRLKVKPSFKHILQPFLFIHIGVRRRRRSHVIDRIHRRRGCETVRIVP
jgi:hypothetical protein